MKNININNSFLFRGDALEILKRLPSRSMDSLVTDPPAGISFMNKDWDTNKGGRDNWISWLTEIMIEVIRILKPGSHGLVWSLPRTSHWTSIACENAGFEIRDKVVHIFGSGFPKSLNLALSIDKQKGVQGHRYTGETGIIARALGQNLHRENDNKHYSKPHSMPEYQGISPEAQRYQGWGTGLKPAHEDWILIRKPIEEKTITEQVLSTGTGGININECRIGEEKITVHNSKKENFFNGHFNAEWKETYRIGRFPANLLLTDINEEWAKYFYCAKVSTAERNIGLVNEPNFHPTVKSMKLMEYLIRLITPLNGYVLDPFTGSGTTLMAAKRGNWKYIGIEMNKEYVSIARKRLKVV